MAGGGTQSWQCYSITRVCWQQSPASSPEEDVLPFLAPVVKSIAVLSSEVEKKKKKNILLTCTFFFYPFSLLFYPSVRTLFSSSLVTWSDNHLRHQTHW